MGSLWNQLLHGSQQLLFVHASLEKLTNKNSQWPKRTNLWMQSKTLPDSPLTALGEWKKVESYWLARARWWRGIEHLRTDLGLSLRREDENKRSTAWDDHCRDRGSDDSSATQIQPVTERTSHDLNLMHAQKLKFFDCTAVAKTVAALLIERTIENLRELTFPIQLSRKESNYWIDSLTTVMCAEHLKK